MKYFHPINEHLEHLSDKTCLTPMVPILRNMERPTTIIIPKQLPMYDCLEFVFQNA